MKYTYYYLLFIIIILFFAYINSRPKQEGFLPALKQLYRPHVRNAKLYGQKLHQTYIAPMTNSLRKNGVI
jgi:hypothetical protein